MKYEPMGKLMSSEEVRGVIINSKTISAAVGVITLLVSLVAAVTMWNQQGFDITQLKERVTKLEKLHSDDVKSLESSLQISNDRTRKTYENILSKMDNLTDKITELTITIKNVQYKQDTQSGLEQLGEPNKK